MTVRVVARIRPQHPHELEEDTILSTAGDTNPPVQPTQIKIPNPKKKFEIFTFQFSSVYDQSATQQQIFDNEVSPTIKHLFRGFDVTFFAYGSTGTGKTHTMRGGKSLAERGVIPRLLSGIYRKARRINKESAGETTAAISLSYYEIYNDKVFDLLEAPEKRTVAGLPLRDNGGKTIVVGLIERPTETLQDFEDLYDRANNHRSTSATKLNAASSRSHAILGIKLVVTTGDEVRISTASAIDLAGSEDNRRTENGKARMVESANINKSLFVLAQCVEAIGSNSHRVPYRESKMTRILSLGQNNGLTVMILNLAPTRPYHLDTLSSLNFANRTKKIEVREIENEPIFKGCCRALSSFPGKSIDRQPLRPLASSMHNRAVKDVKTIARPGDKKEKSFAVYSDRNQYFNPSIHSIGKGTDRPPSPRKRSFDSSAAFCHPKTLSPRGLRDESQSVMSKETIESIIERKVDHILAARALDQASIAPQPEISEELQKRLDLLEQKIESKDNNREQGLTFLLMAKQHAVRGEYASALRMYSLAKPHFPDNKKLDLKIERLQEKVEERKKETTRSDGQSLKKEKSDSSVFSQSLMPHSRSRTSQAEEVRECHEKGKECHEYGSFSGSTYEVKYKRAKLKAPDCASAGDENDTAETPRTRRLLEIINGRDVSQIRLLKGIGIKRAEAIVEALCASEEAGGAPVMVRDLMELERLKGVTWKTVEVMRSGLVAFIEGDDEVIGAQSSLIPSYFLIRIAEDLAGGAGVQGLEWLLADS